MGIDDLELTPALLAALYPESLVAGNTTQATETKPRPKTPATAPVTAYPFMGKNLRSVCFIVHHPAEEFIPASQLEFFIKIITSCKCSMDDIAVVNTGRHTADWQKLKNQFHPRIVFLWGALPAQAGIQEEMPDLLISQWEGVSIVPVSGVAGMSTDSPEMTAQKRQLWKTIQKLFSL